MRKIVRQRDITADQARTKNIGAGIPGASQHIDGFGTRMLKHIPAETITLFATANSAVPTVFPQNPILTFFGVTVVCVVFNIAYLWKNQIGVFQIFLSLFAFAMWVVLLGDEPINSLLDENFGPDFRTRIVAGLLLFWTLFVPFIDLLADRPSRAE